MNPPIPFQVSARERLVVALDFSSERAALGLVDRLQDTCRWFKVGLELYYSAGSSVVEELRRRGYEVFLDLKLHDIPNTVAGAMRSVASVGASLVTIHAAGGEAMMAAAVAAARSTEFPPRLLAVTVLTSMDATQLRGIGVESSPAQQVLRLGRLARATGIDGLVCSPEEVPALRSELGPEMMLVTPGIRGATDAIGDQKRVASAGEAIAGGASMLVVGRPITQAGDPAAAASALLDEITRAEARTKGLK